MSAQHLRELESRRRYATLIAVLLDTEATITDQIFDMHDRIVGRMFNDAKRKHELGFAESGKAINEKVRLYARVGHALIDARQKGLDPYAAIEGVVTWDSFTRSVDEAERLEQPESFDHLHLLTAGYGQVRRYAPTLLETFDFRAACVAAPLMAAIETLRAMNRNNERTFTSAFNPYKDSGDFERAFEDHLKRLVEERLTKSGGGVAGPAPRLERWWQGSPYRGLQVFEFKPSLSRLRPEFIDCHQARNANKALLCACSRCHVSQKGMTKNKRPPHESNKRRLKRRLKRLLSQMDWNDFSTPQKGYNPTLARRRIIE